MTACEMNQTSPSLLSLSSEYIKGSTDMFIMLYFHIAQLKNSFVVAGKGKDW